RGQAFHSLKSEIGFGFAMAMTQVLAEFMISGFGVILPSIAAELRSGSSISPMWPTSILSLVLSALVLPFARLSDIYGGYPFFMVGLLFLIAFTGAAGFTTTEAQLDVFRAMQGIAIAAFEPASFSLIGNAYKPGRRRNIFFGIYGACAPLGFYLGILVGGVALHYAHWGWYFWTASLLAAITAIAAYLSVPYAAWSERHEDLKMDWSGSITLAAGLIMVAYALAAASHTAGGWANPVILAPFLVGLALFVLAIVLEAKVVTCPLLPGEFFRPKGIKPMVVACLFFFGCFGVFLFYSTFYMQQVMNASPLQTVLYFTPMAVGGLIISVVSGSIIHIVPAMWLLLFSGLAWILAPLFIAVAPNTNYFPLVFLSMIFGTLGSDLTYLIFTLFCTDIQPVRYQGLAGALCSVVVNVSIAFSLCLGDMVQS
ncbi:MFS general substrate transporter, partial [Rhizodiscina lignyota]